MKLRPFLRRFKTDLAGWSRFVLVSLLCTGTVVGGAYGAYAAVWPAIVGHSYFRLRSVRIVCDSSAARPSELASRAGLYEGTSLWEVDAAGAVQALSSAPWVRSVHLARRFPSHVSLEVYRREPVAATLGEDGPYLIDRDGIVYREEGKVPFADLPYLTGWQGAPTRAERVVRLRELMTVAMAVAEADVSVSEIHIAADGTFWLYPENRKLSVRLGEDFDPAHLAGRLRTVLATLPEAAHDVREVDLSYPDRAVLRIVEGRTQRVASTLLSKRTARRDPENDRG